MAVPDLVPAIRDCSCRKTRRRAIGAHVKSCGRPQQPRLSSRDLRIVFIALKQYPSLQDDPRDRLGVETSALNWMAKHRLDMVPRVIAVDAVSQSALMSWAEGSLVRDVADSDIDQAIDFLSRTCSASGNNGFP